MSTIVAAIVIATVIFAALPFILVGNGMLILTIAHKLREPSTDHPNA